MGTGHLDVDLLHIPPDKEKADGSIHAKERVRGVEESLFLMRLQREYREPQIERS